MSRGDWATYELAEFLAALSSCTDAAGAQRKAVERVAEALEAEVSALVRDGELVEVVGFPTGRAPTDELLRTAASKAERHEFAGLGPCRIESVSFEDDRNGAMLVGRAGDDPFTPAEVNFLRGAVRVVGLTLRTIEHLAAERRLRAELERQANEIAERQLLLERLAKIQRSISHRAPVQEVLDAVTSGAAELMGEPDAIVGLRLIESSDPNYMVMVSHCGFDADLLAGTLRAKVGEGAGGRAIKEERLVILRDYQASDHSIQGFATRVRTAMAAPVHEHGSIAGSLTVASTRPGRTYSKIEQDVLLAFAEHASLALSDARSVHALHETFKDSISGLTSRALQEKQALEERLRQAQKMEAVGQLAGGVAHDFNNLLMVIQTSAGFLQESLDEGSEEARDANEILEASDRASRLVRQLLTFSRKEVMQPRVIEVNGLITEMQQLLARTIGEDIGLGFEMDRAPCNVMIDPSHMEQIVMNLVINARDAMPEGGSVTIRTTNLESGHEVHSHETLPPGRYVAIEVCDTGVGMDEDTAARVFEPFFTTKERGRGTGLGLATVYGIVDGVRGTISVRSEPGRGTTFTVMLPAAREGELPGDDVTVETDEGRGIENARVLVVEDEEGVRNLVKRILERNGFEVSVAASGVEALGHLEDRKERFQLAITDVVMPEMSGVELAHRIQDLDSDCRVVFISGYTDDRIADPSIINERCGFLQKPFTEVQMMAAIQNILDGDLAVGATTL